MASNTEQEATGYQSQRSDPSREELLELIELNGKRIEFLCGYEDLGCDGTLEELQACRGWLKTYQDMLKELDDNESGS